MTLQWDSNPEQDIAGYRVHKGTSSGNYTETLDVGPTTTATIENLSSGTEYFFAVTAYNTSGLESDPSAELSHIPLNEPPSVSLTSPTSEETFTAPAAITLIANASDNDGSISRVDFYSGATVIGTAASSPYSITWENVPAGTYTLFATAVDNEGASAISQGLTITVATPPNQPPFVSLTSPVPEATFTAPAAIPLSATATDSDGSVTRVDFYSGATMIGTATSSPYSITWENVPAGTYTLSAIAIDNEGANAFSEGVAIIINPPAAPTSPGVGTLTWLPDGSFQFAVTDAVGQTNDVYVSDDMLNWTLLTTEVNATGTLVINDPTAATAERRFYRVSTSNGTEDPVGFIKMRIAGTTESQSPAYSYLGLSLTNPTAYTGSITSWTNQSVTDGQATWTDNQFNGESGEFFLEIVSGPNAGFMTDILATNEATRTLTLYDDLSGLLEGGETYRILKHRTIADVFGPNNEAGLNGASTVSDADEIKLLDPVTQEYLTYYFQTDGTGGIGWRFSTDPVADASQTTLYGDQGVIICRKIPGDITLSLTGTVRPGPTIVPVGSSLNLVANVYPAGNLTLGNCNIYLGKNSSGLEGAKSISQADEVQIFDGVSFQNYFYKTGGAGGNGWRNANDDWTDASGTPIPLGASVFIVRKSGLSFYWKIPQPFEF